MTTSFDALHASNQTLPAADQHREVLLNVSALGKSLVLALVVVAIGQVVRKGYRVRRRMYELKKMGLAMPPWSPITGHFFFLRRFLARYPLDNLMSVTIKDLFLDHFQDTEMFYLDLWPLTQPTLVVCNAAASADVNRRLNTKPLPYGTFFDPQSGGPSILSSNGAAWKWWRKALSPGFGNRWLSGKIGVFVDGMEILCDIFAEQARTGKVFGMENKIMRLTQDLVIKLAINDDLDYQRQDHFVPTVLARILPLVSFSNLGFDTINLWRYYQIRRCDREINPYFANQLRKRYNELQESHGKSTSESVMSISIATYIKETYTDKGHKAPGTLDESFIKEAIPHIRMFLIAGQDTTPSISAYCYNNLYHHPYSLALIRAEHDRVFGLDPSFAASLLRSSDGFKLLNKLPYTLAVIKETLRLCPPGGAFRVGSTAVQLLDKTGTPYPTDGVFVSLAHHGLHYNPNLFADANIFRPERWMYSSEPSALYTQASTPGAYRPFERGSRMCIGQDIAIMLIKVLLVMTVRTFEVEPRYGEDDVEVHGEKAYQTENFGTRPKKGYPCVVRKVGVMG